MSVATPGQTLDQRRAAHAWGVITELAQRPEAERKAIQRAAKKLPMRILTAGLGHALLFVETKGKAPDLLSTLSQWVLVERPRVAPATADLLQAIVTGNADDLRRYMAETIVWLAWFNRFAEAEFGVVDETEGTES